MITPTGRHPEPARAMLAADSDRGHAHEGRTIARQSPIPYHHQLFEILRDGIRSGIWPPGAMIPSEAQLAKTYGISRTVIRSAVQRLAVDRLVERIKGKGTVVGASEIDRDALATAGERDIEGRGRDLAAQERDDAAALRDQEADARDATAGDLDRTAGRRAVSDGQQAANERDRVASGRAEAADNRAQAINDRKIAADDRSQAAKDREDSGTDGVDRGVSRQGAGQAAQDRDDAAELRDREADARDDVASGLDRTARQRVASDRQHAADERGRAASGRSEAANDRAQAVNDRKVAANDRALAINDRKVAADDRAQAHLDLTDLRVVQLHLEAANADLEASNRELEAFSYSVSHDLRAPLRAIDGFSRLLLEENGAELSAEAAHRLQVVRDGAKQMGSLIDDLLRFSRIGRLELKKRDVSVVSLVEGVVNELREAHPGREIEVTVGDLPPCRADASLLKQIFRNLLDNAFKFTGTEADPHIEVGWLHGPGEGGDGTVTYYVKDNGVGFDMQYQDKLFGVFQRLHRAEDFPGTGVGLALVRRIVERHGGQVWAEGATGHGSTFFVRLERANATN